VRFPININSAIVIVLAFPSCHHMQFSSRDAMIAVRTLAVVLTGRIIHLHARGSLRATHNCQISDAMLPYDS
jgi:hypothetical protein